MKNDKLDNQVTPFPLYVEMYQYQDSNYDNWHQHEQAHLIFCDFGEALLETKKGIAKIDSSQAVLVPNGLLHRLIFIDASAINCVYFNYGTPTLTLEVIKLTNLMRGLFNEVLAYKERFGYFTSLMTVKKCLYYQIINLTGSIYREYIPSDKRLRKICSEITNNISDDSSIREIAFRFGMSERTLLRLSMAEINCSISKWRNKQRVLKSIDLLSQGLPLKLIHNAVGYSSQSAFIETFKRYTGVTPSDYKKGL